MADSILSGVIMRSFIHALIEVNVRSGGIGFYFVNTKLKKQFNFVAASDGESSTLLFTIGKVDCEECLGLNSFQNFFVLLAC